MKIDIECINHNEILLVDEILSTSWDSVTDTDEKWWLANQMYLNGVHDMAEALRKVYKA